MEFKERFDTLKKEIFWMNFYIKGIKEEISELRGNIFDLNSKLNHVLDEARKPIFMPISIKPSENSIPTQTPTYPTDAPKNPADNSPFKPLKEENKVFSTGNGGVPADRQTNQQTGKSTINTEQPLSIRETEQILTSLDSFKKDLRIKFKRLTDQEFLVFSTIYQLDQEFGYCDYKSLSEKLSLTESSVRDYVCKLIKKETPIVKTKLNNKSIHLNILSNFQKIAPLSLLLNLRDI